MTSVPCQRWILQPNFWWILAACITLSTVNCKPRCGGLYTAPRGVLQTPGFPGRFPVPINCEWVIEAQQVSSGNTSIIVYLTQLFVFEGLVFKEYQIYDQTYQLNGRVIHTVTETNVTKVSYVETKQDYLVISLKMDNIESSHLRVLDNLLDVYGFNITYEIGDAGPRRDRCTMMDCGFTGNCYDYYTKFSCDCFPGYEGPGCSDGSNSLCAVPDPPCKNDGRCMHVGDSTIRCVCPTGFTGEFCESQSNVASDDCDECSVSCPFDGRPENICKCPEDRNSTSSNDKIADFLITTKFLQPSNTKTSSIKSLAEQQILESLKDSLPIVQRTQFLQFQSGAGYYEISYAISVPRTYERRLRSTLNKWTDRGYIGKLNLITQQPITISMPHRTTTQFMSMSPGIGVIHEGANLSLVCSSSLATTAPSFVWLKDGLFVNVTAPTSGKRARVFLDPEKRDQYHSELTIRTASSLDEGKFTCQVVSSGMQQCINKRVEVRAPPRVWIVPMSLSVRKGENFTIKCFSASTSNHKNKYTYSWTRNKVLLPAKTDTEHYEELFPMGSILQVSNINKSTWFSCLVQDSAVWAEQSILVNVIDVSLMKTCPGERHLKLLWPETAPGSESLQECPAGYLGVARRSCDLRDTALPAWELPDYSGCTPNKLVPLDNEFQKLLLGYGTFQPRKFLLSYKHYVDHLPPNLLPGEGSRILRLVYSILSYVNGSIKEDEGDAVLDVVDQLLQRKLSVINQTQIILLQQVVKRQCLLFESTYRKSAATIDVTLTNVDKMGFNVPQAGMSYPDWFSYKLHLALPRLYTTTTSATNGSATLAVVVYRNLYAFLPQRSAIRLKDGSEMDYEIISNIASAWLKINRTAVDGNFSGGLISMEFNHSARNASLDGWKILCASTDYATFGYSWDIERCITRSLGKTKTRCLCPGPGTYAILVARKLSFAEVEAVPTGQLIVLSGCSICAVLTAITTIILSFHWLFHKSYLTFLKIQCTVSLLGSMLVFIYASWSEPPSDSFLTVMSFLEGFLLTGMSSQMSKLLIVYSELVLVQMPRSQSIKQTVVLITTGAPMIAMFGNHMAHLTMNTRTQSWWILFGTLSFKLFVTCCLIIFILYFTLFHIIVKKITNMHSRPEKIFDPINIRLGLLRRSALVLCSITGTIFSSIIYVNYVDDISSQYLFSSLSILTGIVVFTFYILYSESSIIAVLLRGIRERRSSTPDNSKQMHFFANQKAGISDEYCGKDISEADFFGDASACKQKIGEVGTSSFKTHSSGGFRRNPMAGHSSQTDQYCERGSDIAQMDLNNSPDLLALKKFVELDLVASSMQNSHEQSSSYESAAAANAQTPTITITQAETFSKVEYAERQRPEGEESMSDNIEIVPDISLEEAEMCAATAAKQPADDNLDSVMDSITHDLEYLLNDFGSDGNASKTTATTTATTAAAADSSKRMSRPPPLSVFEQIVEESEEELKVTDNDPNVAATSC